MIMFYQAQDIIIESQTTSNDHNIQQGKTHLVKRLFRQVFRQRNSGKQDFDDDDLQKVELEIASILEEMSSCTSTDIGGSDQVPPSTITSSTMVGFDEQIITKIKDQLCGQSQQLQIIPISGMGGIGKTTLARYIFDDKLVVSYFDVSVWVTISQEYHIKKLLQSILDSLNEVTHEIRELSEPKLMLYIYQYLKGRRYLVVMDDIWSTRVLDDINMIFPNDGNGSRIVLTTRLSDVAGYASTSGSLHHEIQLLDEEQSWNLLRDKVFGQNEDCPGDLEDLGKSIAKNCRGLPLAIVVVAGVLSKVDRIRYKWEVIASNVSSVVIENDKNFSKLLSLSYNHLPHHLKPCFLYVGGFPEDYEISASRLIRLWIAEGLLKPIESKTLEEVGNEYLEDLVKRNLVLVTKKMYNGRLKICSIHDLLRDLCIERVRDEDFFHVTDENGYIPKAGENVMLRVCLYSYHCVFNSRRLLRAEYGSSRVRTILCFGDCFVDNWSLLGVKQLRVLDALQIKLHSFPEIIFELFHLRYIAFYLDPHQPTRVTVSRSITELKNLQTLVMSLGSKHDISLPYEMWKMTQLRHLLIDKMTMSPVPFNANLVCLQYLQTLLTLEDFRFTAKALGSIPNLRKLKVRYTNPRSEKWELYCLNNLVSLSQLEELKIIFSLFPSPSGVDVINPFPQGFAFPKNLKKLSLEGCTLPWKDMTAVGSLPNLEVLKLHSDSMVGETWEPVEGEFSQLKFMLMEKLDLKHWLANNTHFPLLKHLRIKECRKLEVIPFEFGDISTLELIELHDCELAVDSAKEIQNEQEDMGNDSFQVRVYNRAG